MGLQEDEPLLCRYCGVVSVWIAESLSKPMCTVDGKAPGSPWRGGPCLPPHNTAGFGRGGGDHGTLSHLSVLCALINGFRGEDTYDKVVWHGITTDNE